MGARTGSPPPSSPMPTNSEHDRLLMHFDDGMDEIITLPDNTVRLTGETVVARCKCARCAVRPEAEDGGCTLPLPQPARPRRRSCWGALNRV